LSILLRALPAWNVERDDFYSPLIPLVLFSNGLMMVRGIFDSLPVIYLSISQLDFFSASTVLSMLFFMAYTYD